MSYLKLINWLDVFALILLIRICYISVKTGFPNEFFKLLGTVFASYLACHYYIKVSFLFNHFLSLKSEGVVNILVFLIFFALAFSGYLVFVLIRMSFAMLIRMEAASLLNRWGALILGMVRFCLLSSLIFFAITVIKIGYLENSLSSSLSGPTIVNLAPDFYRVLQDNLVSRFADKQESK
ncbi:CvpA family protein [Candidatus Omnitrophota bacterium]